MPVERNIREILASGESTLLEADMSRRLDMLVRQGLMPVSKLPLLKRGLEKLQMGKVGTPQERDAINSLLNSMMFIVLGDDTVFQRARQHTQKNRYQAEESETVEEEMDMCNCDCDCDGPICDTCKLMKPVMECADEKDFKPHMMYDPKTGKGYMAKEYKDHVRMDKMGYTHDKPEVKESDAYYAHHAAKKLAGGKSSGAEYEKHVESEMKKRGYKKAGYMGSGAYNYVKEEVELVEVSKKMLQSYRQKNETDREKAVGTQDVATIKKRVKGERLASKKIYSDVYKRHGLSTAKVPATNEEVGLEEERATANHADKIEKHLGKNYIAQVEDGGHISVIHKHAKSDERAHEIHVHGGHAKVVHTETGETKGKVEYKGTHHLDNLSKLAKKHDSHLKEELQKDFRHTQQDSTELNGDGNRDRGRYGEDLTGDKKMFQFQPGNPFAKAKQQMQEGAYKRMATDDEEDARLKAQKKAARLSRRMAKQEKETDPGIKEAEEKFEELLEKNVPTNPKLWSKFKAQAKAKFDVYPSAYANGWAAKQYKKAGGSWRSESVEFDELTDQLDEYITSKQVKMAKGIANDPRHKGGDMTGASKKMEKIKKGLSNHPGAKKALRLANEGVFDDYTDEELDELIEMEYKAKFQAMLKKTGKSLASMSPEEKKKFFNSVDAAHNAKNESYTMKNTYAKSGAMAKDKASHNTGGFRISNKDAAAAKQRLMQKKGIKEDAASDAKRDYDRDDKRGLAPTKKDKPAKVSDASNAKEIEHIVPQLRKAITVGKEVQFQDGKTHKISKGHAAKFLNKYMNSKPAQKSDMQSSAHKSHDHFMKHV